MSDPTPIRVRFEAFELDEANARLARNGQPVSLPPKAFAVLCALARQPGQLVTKNALLDAVWGHQHVSESLLKNIISSIRAALSDDARAPRIIETASRFGYRFIADIANSQASAPAAGHVPAGAIRSPSAPSIIGREAALARMREVWHRAKSGQSQLLWIAGEAGVGKTTLIESFVSELGPRVAAFGRCVEHFGTGEPYLPVLEVVKEICRLEPELVRLMRTVAPTWLIQMPWLISEAERTVLHRELAGAHPDRMLREIRELMDHFSANRPICFILEDMHWSDLGTLRMMEIFARRPRQVPILWIASFRLAQIIAENHPLRGVRQELKVQRLCEEIVLDPFSEAEVAEYLAHRLPRAADFPHSFIKRLHEHTEGLPLFVASVTDTLVMHAERDPTTIERWQANPHGPLPVPESLAGVIDTKASTLPPEVQAILEAASVCGNEFRAGTVADMIAREAQWVRDRCDDLVRRQIWLKQTSIVELPNGDFDSRYAFLHALYHHVLYERLAMSQRVQHHRRAALALTNSPVVGETVPVAELASHYERGHAIPAALRAYAEAAALAMGHFAPRDSEHLSVHGLSLLPRMPEGEERMELELALQSQRGVAASQLYGVASNEARDAFARVEALCNRLPQTPLRALTLNGLGWIYYVRGDFQEALALAARLEQIATEHDDATLFMLACNLRGVPLVNMGELRSSCEWLERGIRKALELGDAASIPGVIVDPEAAMRMNMSFSLVRLGLIDQAHEQLTLGRRRAERVAQPLALALHHWAAGMVEARLEDTPALARHAAGIGKIVETTMLAQARGPSLWLRGLVEVRSGQPAAGLERILEGYDFHARLGMYCGCPEVLGYAAEAQLVMGEWQAARKQLEAAFNLAQKINEGITLPDLYLLQARLEVGEKNLDAARAALKEAMLVATAQEARLLQMQILTALVEMDGGTATEVAALAQMCGLVTEGRDSPAHKRAVATLAAHR